MVKGIENQCKNWHLKSMYKHHVSLNGKNIGKINICNVLEGCMCERERYQHKYQKRYQNPSQNQCKTNTKTMPEKRVAK